MDTSLSSAVSALTAQSAALSTVSTNLANSSTTGYKAVSTQFLSLLNSTTSSSTSVSSYTGGVSTTTRQNVTDSGTITSTSSATDMAISGNGFFVVSDGTNTYYTRDGEFVEDSSGNLYLSGTNYYLMGWATDSNGTVTGDESSLSSLTKINIGQSTLAASASTSYTLSANLPSEAQSDVNTLSYTDANDNSQTLNYAWTSTGSYTDSASGSTYNTYLVSITSSDSSATLSDGSASGQSTLTYSVTTDSDGNVVSVTGTSGNTIGYTDTELPTSITVTDSSGNDTSVDTSSETWSAVEDVSGYSTTSSVTIYDSQGTAETVPVTWTAAGDNTWVMTVSNPVNSSGTTTSGVLSDSSGASTNSYSYIVTFNSDGSIASISPASEMNGDTLSTAPTDSSGNAEITTYSWTDGSSASTVTMNFSSLTQYDSGESSPTMTTNSYNVDGYSAGTLSSVAVDTAGEIVATYSNGQTKVLYKVAVANFANANGLTEESSGVYAQSNTSGSVILSEAGQNGTGTISGSSLESSNVDTTTQFTDMISCQQAYSAASQIISTTSKMFDTLMQAAP